MWNKKTNLIIHTTRLSSPPPGLKVSTLICSLSKQNPVYAHNLKLSKASSLCQSRVSINSSRVTGNARNSLKRCKTIFANGSIQLIKTSRTPRGSFWKSSTSELCPLSWNTASLFITDGRTQVIGAILRCSRSREIASVFVRVTPARVGALALRIAEENANDVGPYVGDVPARVIRFTYNGAPLASVCSSAPPDTPATLIRWNGDTELEYTQRPRRPRHRRYVGEVHIALHTKVKFDNFILCNALYSEHVMYYKGRHR